MLWRRVAAVPATCAGITLRKPFDRAESVSQVPWRTHLAAVGWIDVLRFVSSSTSHQGRSRRRPHTVPSWRAAVNGEPRRKGTGTPPCPRVDGAPGRPAADLPPGHASLGSTAGADPRPAHGPVAGGAGATARRRSPRRRGRSRGSGAAGSHGLEARRPAHRAAWVACPVLRTGSCAVGMRAAAGG